MYKALVASINELPHETLKNLARQEGAVHLPDAAIWAAAVLVGIFHPFQADRDRLIYGGGMDPYVNIVDEKDIPIPAFGPVEIQ